MFRCRIECGWPEFSEDKHSGTLCFTGAEFNGIVGTVNNADLTDEQWTQIQRVITPNRSQRFPARIVIDGWRYRQRSQCAWHELPSQYPPAYVIQWNLRQWRKDETLPRIIEAVKANCSSD